MRLAQTSCNAHFVKPSCDLSHHGANGRDQVGAIGMRRQRREATLSCWITSCCWHSRTNRSAWLWAWHFAGMDFEIEIESSSRAACRILYSPHPPK